MEELMQKQWFAQKNLTEPMFRRGMRLFFDVTDSAPCTVIPESLFVLPGVMVGAQRKVAKKMIKFGTPR